MGIDKNEDLKVVLPWQYISYLEVFDSKKT